MSVVASVSGSTYCATDEVAQAGAAAKSWRGVLDADLRNREPDLRDHRSSESVDAGTCQQRVPQVSIGAMTTIRGAWPTAGAGTAPAKPSVSLDDVAKRIIELLQEDGRQSYAAIAQAVGLSEAAVRQRVQRLLDADVMQIVAVTDPLQVGFPRQAMIGLRVEGDIDARSPTRCPTMAEVAYVVTTAGSFDLLAEVVCEDDDHLLDAAHEPDPHPPGRHGHRDVRLPEAQQAALQLGYPMSTNPTRRLGTHLGPPHRHRRAVRRRRPRPPLDALHPPLGLRGGPRAAGPHRADHHPRRGLDRSGTTAATSTSTASPASSSSRSATAARSSPRRPPSRPRSSPSSRSGRYAHPRAIELAERLAATRPATSTASSSPPAAARPSRPRGSWPSSTSS